MSAQQISPWNDKFQDECGVVGIWNHADAAQLAYLGLYAMQHRGQESAGVVALGEPGDHRILKGPGLVSEVFDGVNWEKLAGRAAIGHVRYSTSGRDILTNIQPLTAQIATGPLALAHNGNVLNAFQLREMLKAKGAIFSGTNDTEILLHLLARHPSRNIVTALLETAPTLVGAYSLVLMTQDTLVAVRDPLGFRPLVLGEKTNEKNESSWVVASETCALDLVQARFVREIEAGEVLVIDKSGFKSHFLPQITTSNGQTKAQCVFEHVYFARPDSVVFSHSVYEVRKELGRILAKESPVDADVIVPVPDSGVPAAIGYSLESGLPFEFGIIRNHYVGRTFIQPEAKLRDGGVRIKLNPQPAVLKDKRVILIDDSLVRGTTSQKIVSLVRQAGAREVHLRISAPPTVGPCYYGVDTPDKAQLIACQMNVDEICRVVNADSLAYLSVDGLLRAVKSSKDFCAACFTQEYPTEIPSSGGLRTW